MKLTEEQKAKKREEYQKNRESYIQRTKEWIKKHPKRARENSRKATIKWRAKYPEKVKKNNIAYNLRHPHRMIANARASRLNLKGEQCVHCGVKDSLEFHHTNYEFDEGVTLCKSCHKNVHLGNINRFQVEG